MNISHRKVVASMFALLAITACSGIKKVTTPSGRTWPDADSTAIEKARLDSINAVNAALEAARQDSLNKARALEDSLRLAREAEQRSTAQLENVNAVLMATIYFDYDQSSLTDAAREALDAKATALKNNPSITIRIVGHTDERGADEYNLALGLRRASEAKRYLVQNGVDGGRISVTSLGEEMPAVQGDVEESYARNRRAEFAITSGS